MGQATTFLYDPLNRLKKVTYADASTITVTWDDANRTVTLADSNNGTLTQVYDDLGRLTRESGPQGQIDYQYDAAGRRRQMTIAGVSTPITYDYDAADRLTQVAQGTIATVFGYDAADRRTSTTLPNGVVATWSYSDANEITGITYDKGSTHIGDLAYTYDAAGRRTGASGSLATLLMPATVSSTNYDAANRLSNWGGTALSYDNNGSLTAYGATTYSWNARNELIATSDGTSSFSYDAMGRRRSRTVSGVTTGYLHDGLNPATAGGDVMLAGTNVDEFYAQITGGIPTSYLQDALGSTTALTDVAGAISASYSYGPYGDVAKSGSANAAFQFTARERDLPNLQFNRGRYFMPGIGRFISEDPMGLAAGVNLYAYAGNNPVEYSDPSGECPWCVGFVIGAGFDLVMQLAQNGGNLSCVSIGQVLASGALGAIGGGIGGKGLSSVLRGLSNKAKGGIGEGLSILENRLGLNRLVETQTRSIPGQRTIVDSTWRSIRGITYYVESKFGMSGLTKAQRAAQQAVGDLYHVERWGYSFFERVGAYIGGTERAVSEQAALPPPEAASGEDCKCH